MVNEHKNLCAEVLSEILYYALANNMGWKAKLTITFTDDERKAMEAIVEDYHRRKSD